MTLKFFISTQKKAILTIYSDPEFIYKVLVVLLVVHAQWSELSTMDTG